jgi:hypothetical protein
MDRYPTHDCALCQADVATLPIAAATETLTSTPLASELLLPRNEYGEVIGVGW